HEYKIRSIERVQLLLSRRRCKRLQFLLEALEVLDETSSKSFDLVVKAGEKLSCYVINAFLLEMGFKTRFVNLDKALDNTVSLPVDYCHVASLVLAAIQPDTLDQVLVIPGFMGNFPGGLYKSLGRGYTDITAAVVSCGLKADELNTWKLTDGIFTADPQKVTGARLLAHLTPEEAYELTYYGAEAVHPLSIEILNQAGVTLRLLNIKRGPHPAAGTCISSSIPDQAGQLATAVVLKEGVVVINVHSNRKLRSHDFLRKIFANLNAHHLITDLISTSEVHLSMALSRYDVCRLDAAIKDLEAFGTVEITKDQSIISLVGRRIPFSGRYPFYIVADFLSPLTPNLRANLEIISQASSEINISVVTCSKHADLALQSIHDRLLTGTHLAL
ncbi:Aspartokinase, partial [Massospora cicadina]